jgi:hypothetical protein
MRAATLLFAALGILSGVVFLVGPLWYSPGLPRGQVIAPLVLGVLVISTHGFNIVGLRGMSSRIPRAPLIAANMLFFVFFVFGLLFIIDKHLYGAGILWGYALIYLVPLPMNSIYWLAFDAGSAER